MLKCTNAIPLLLAFALQAPVPKADSSWPFPSGEALLAGGEAWLPGRQTKVDQSGPMVEAQVSEAIWSRWLKSPLPSGRQCCSGEKKETNVDHFRATRKSCRPEDDLWFM